MSQVVWVDEVQAYNSIVEMGVSMREFIDVRHEYDIDYMSRMVRRDAVMHERQPGGSAKYPGFLKNFTLQCTEKSLTPLYSPSGKQMILAVIFPMSNKNDLVVPEHKGCYADSGMTISWSSQSLPLLFQLSQAPALQSAEQILPAG